MQEEYFNFNNAFKSRFVLYSGRKQQAFWRIVQSCHDWGLDWYFIDKAKDPFEVRSGYKSPDQDSADKCLMGLHFLKDQIRFALNLQYREHEIGDDIKEYHNIFITEDIASQICDKISCLPRIGNGHFPRDYRR